MQTVAIRDLKTNPSILTNSLEKKEYTMITQKNEPIGIAISLDDTLITNGLKTALIIDAYKKGFLSLGQLSKSLNLNKIKSMKMLSLMGIDVIDYDFEDDMKFMDSFL